MTPPLSSIWDAFRQLLCCTDPKVFYLKVYSFTSLAIKLNKSADKLFSLFSSISLQSSKVEFVSAGAKIKGIPRCHNRSGMGILTEARDWVLLADVNGQLKFPSEVVTTRLRPDLIIYSTSTKRIVW